MVLVIVVAMAVILVGVSAIQARRLTAQGLRWRAAGIPLAFAIGSAASFVVTRWWIAGIVAAAAGAIALVALMQARRYPRRTRTD